MSRVDVIVPCYRYGHFLRQCVESVLRQEGVDVRILIIDDCSPDETAEVAKDLCNADSRVTFFRHQINKGHIATYNEGIEWTSAPYYLLLSADDYLLPGALRRTTELLDSHSEVGLAFGQQITLNEGTILDYRKAEDVAFDWKVVSGLKFIETSGARNCVPTPTAVVRTELQKKVGGYRADLPHSGDMEMWMRIAAHADIGISQEYHAVYRRHASNMSLGYTARHWLPDLQQRKAAIDCLLLLDGLDTNEAKRLHRNALRLLAFEAVKFASSAFNHDEIDLSRQLREFARGISPGINLSKPWAKLALKRCVGYRNWQGMRASFSKLRQIVAAE